MRFEAGTKRGRRIMSETVGQTKTARGGFALNYGSFPRSPGVSAVSAQNGDTVYVHYLGKFPGGKTFDTSMKAEAIKAGLFTPAREYKPLEVVLGKHQVISGFEEALLGMKVNETKEITLPPEKAYGKTGRHPMAGKTLQFRLLVTNIKRP
jgi:FKBP-type peptidyl-prolyl cis-trans isomerase 2